jgi:hypothetical protein
LPAGSGTFHSKRLRLRCHVKRPECTVQRFGFREHELPDYLEGDLGGEFVLAAGLT